MRRRLGDLRATEPQWKFGSAMNEMLGADTGPIRPPAALASLDDEPEAGDEATADADGFEVAELAADAEGAEAAAVADVSGEAETPMLVGLADDDPIRSALDAEQAMEQVEDQARRLRELAFEALNEEDESVEPGEPDAADAAADAADADADADAAAAAAADADADAADAATDDRPEAGESPVMPSMEFVTDAEQRYREHAEARVPDDAAEDLPEDELAAALESMLQGPAADAGTPDSEAGPETVDDEVSFGAEAEAAEDPAGELDRTLEGMIDEGLRADLDPPAEVAETGLEPAAAAEDDRSESSEIAGDVELEAVPETAPDAAVAADLEAELQPEPHAELEAELQPESHTDLEAELQPESQADLENDPHAELEAEPHAELEGEPQADLETDPDAAAAMPVPGMDFVGDAEDLFEDPANALDGELADEPVASEPPSRRKSLSTVRGALAAKAATLEPLKKALGNDGLDGVDEGSLSREQMTSLMVDLDRQLADGVETLLESSYDAVADILDLVFEESEEPEEDEPELLEESDEEARPGARRREERSGRGATSSGTDDRSAAAGDEQLDEAGEMAGIDDLDVEFDEVDLDEPGGGSATSTSRPAAATRGRTGRISPPRPAGPGLRERMVALMQEFRGDFSGAGARMVHGAMAALSRPLDHVPPDWRTTVDWVAISLAFWVPIVWLLVAFVF